MRPTIDGGYIDKSGRFAIPPQFHIAHPFSEGLASVRIGEKMGYVDKTGSIAINPQFDLALPFCGGLARVDIGHWVRDRVGGERFEGKFGYINKQGEYVWKQIK